MATFTQYAVAAAADALDDAGLKFMSERDRNHTGVCIGSGIGSFVDAYSNTSKYNEHVSKPFKLFTVPFR